MYASLYTILALVYGFYMIFVVMITLICVCVYIYIYRYACMRVMYLRMYAPVYVSMCMCMYACMHLCTHERIGEFQGLALRAPLPARAVPSEHRCTIEGCGPAALKTTPEGPSDRKARAGCMVSGLESQTRGASSEVPQLVEPARVSQLSIASMGAVSSLMGSMVSV